LSLFIFRAWLAYVRLFDIAVYQQRRRTRGTAVVLIAADALRVARVRHPVSAAGIHDIARAAVYPPTSRSRMSR